MRARMMITSTRGLYLICTAMICIMLLKRTSVDALCNLCVKEGSECHPDSFPCFRDCCLIDQAFCDSNKKKCVQCHDLEHRCGNHSMPIECRLFCYKLRAGQNTGPEETFSHSNCITTLCIIGAFSVLLAVAFGMTIITFRFKTKDCRRCSKKLWRMKKKKDETEDTETEMTTKQRDHQRLLRKSSSKPGPSPDTHQTSGPTNVQPTEAGPPLHPVFPDYPVNAPTSNIRHYTGDATPASETAVHGTTRAFNDTCHGRNESTYQRSTDTSQPKLNNIIPSAEQSNHHGNVKPLALSVGDPSKGYEHA